MSYLTCIRNGGAHHDIYCPSQVVSMDENTVSVSCTFISPFIQLLQTSFLKLSLWSPDHQDTCMQRSVDTKHSSCALSFSSLLYWKYCSRWIDVFTMNSSIQYWFMDSRFGKWMHRLSRSVSTFPIFVSGCKLIEMKNEMKWNEMKWLFGLSAILAQVLLMSLVSYLSLPRAVVFVRSYRRCCQWVLSSCLWVTSYLFTCHLSYLYPVTCMLVPE